MTDSSRTGTRWAVSLLAVLAASASDAQAPGSRDSAGVAIVEHPAAAPVQRYELRPVTVEIGTTPGSELVRVISALRMPDGKIVVADGGRRQLIRFGTNGALERILGRDGAGPGEFSGIRSMSRRGRDSIAVYDGRHFRYAVFTDSGFARQTVLFKSEHMYLAEMNLIGLLSNGNALVTAGGSLSLGDEGPARTERKTFPVVSFGPDGQPGRLLGTWPGWEVEVHRLTEGRMAGGFARRFRLFGATSVFATSGDHFIMVDNARFQFDVMNGNGQLVRRVRRQHPPQPVRQTHMTVWADEGASAIRDPEQRAARKATYERQTHAPVFPALDERVVVDAVRRIWLGSYKRPGDAHQDWWIFTIEGAIVGRVSVPAALTVTDAGTDYVLGVWRDEDGVQTVRLYGLAPSR